MSRADLELIEVEAPVLTENGLEELPSLHDEHGPIWKRCLDSKMGPKMLRAMRLLLAGYRVNEILGLVGYKDSRQVFATAARMGVMGTTARIRELNRANAQLALERVGDALLVEDIRPKELAIIAGIAHDKITREEERAHTRTQVTNMSQLLEGIAESLASKKLSLTLKVEPRQDSGIPDTVTIEAVRGV